ncbi:MAG: RNA polymerase sigma factor [Flavobacteriales bacterium]|jgi:RNA polymerase sigma factor (sigma-70 family)
MSDQELLQRFRDPHTSGEGFQLIVRQFQRPIYYYVRRMVLDHDDANDITQSTFIRAWKGLSGFRGESQLSTWLHTIAYREALHFLEQKKRIGKVPADQVAQRLEAVLAEDTLYTGDDIQRRLQVAVATLPPRQKAVFVMKYFEEKKYDEIAEITGTSVGALKASYHHAVQKVEDHLLRYAHQSPQMP